MRNFVGLMTNFRGKIVLPLYNKGNQELPLYIAFNSCSVDSHRIGLSPRPPRNERIFTVFSPVIARRFAISLACSLSLSGGCSLLSRRQVVAPTPIPTPAGPQPPKIDFARIRPNELGVIPVIMYHDIKDPKPGNKPRPLTRSIASFKQDLEVLYKAGYRPINLSDAVNDRIDVPTGLSPVVLTFDDARASQFQLKESADSLQVEPNCAVGIMDAFHKAHPDWPMRATFFILPKSKTTMEPFGQLGQGGQKIDYILQQGMEIGNHTVLHKSLRRMTSAEIQQEIGGAHKSILEAAPNAKISVFAAPMGEYPRDKKLWPLLLKGEYGGTPYEYSAAFTAAWRPMPSPASLKFNPVRLERIDSVDGLNGIRDWIKKLGDGTAGMPRYISDGDPQVISYPKGDAPLSNVGKIKAEGKLAYAYEPFGGAGGSKPIVSDGSTPATMAKPGIGPKRIVGGASATPGATAETAKPVTRGR
jgi:peptidoglycan/xylan/chitin deacetylase (PgdA/CDA1 family)